MNNLNTLEEISAWLLAASPNNAAAKLTLNNDGTVDVEGGIEILGIEQPPGTIAVERIPFQFGVINGYYNVVATSMKDLKGSPHTVNGSVFIGALGLKSLIYGPQHVTGEYWCESCGLETFDGAPRKVAGFSCGVNNNTNLDGIPDVILGNFQCRAGDVPRIEELKNQDLSDVEDDEDEWIRPGHEITAIKKACDEKKVISIDTPSRLESFEVVQARKKANQPL